MSASVNTSVSTSISIGTKSKGASDSISIGTKSKGTSVGIDAEGGAQKSQTELTKIRRLVRDIHRVYSYTHSADFTQGDEVVLPDGRVYTLSKSSGKHIASVIAKNIGSVKRVKKPGNKSKSLSGTGFDKLVRFSKPVVDYISETLLKYAGKNGLNWQDLVMFQKQLGADRVNNPLYGVGRHSTVTKVLDACNRINDILSPDSAKSVYLGDDKFIKAFRDSIDAAIEKDRERGYTPADPQEMEKILEENGNLTGYMFNPRFFTHAQQSKIIETSKDKSKTFVDDITSEYTGERRGDIVLLSVIDGYFKDKLEGYTSLYDMFEKQDEAIDSIKTHIRENMETAVSEGM